MVRRAHDTRTLDLFAPRPPAPSGGAMGWQPPTFHVLDPAAVEIRPYFQHAFDAWNAGGNFGLVADTATGKTYIAYALADAVLAGGRRILFCATTVILCEQHAELARTLFHTAADDVRFVRSGMTAKRRAGSWVTGRIHIATPQVAANDIASGVCALDDVGLVILDEAHHAARTHASIAVANAAHARGIRILALTASPGGTMERIERIRTNLHLDRWVRIPEEDTQAFRPPTVTDPVVVPIAPEVTQTVTELEGLLERLTNVLAQEQYLEHVSRVPSPADLKRAGDRIRAAGALGILPTVAAAQQIATVLTLLVSDGYATALASMRRALEKVNANGRPTKTARRLRATPEVQRTLCALEALVATNATHPKQAELLNAIQRAIARASERPRVLVFDRYAEGAIQLVERIRAAFGVRAEVALGRARMRPRLLVQTLHAFGQGEFPILVGTDVVREGIHVPSIDELVVYSPPRNERELIQLFGRVGRMCPGGITTITAAHEYDRRYVRTAAVRGRRMREVLDAARSATPASRTNGATHRSMFTRHPQKLREGFVRALCDRFVHERFRIIDAHVDFGRSGRRRPFVRMLVGDRTGTIPLLHWCPKGHVQAEAFVREFPPGTVVIVSGTYEEYEGPPQIIVNPSERQGITRCPEGDYVPADYDDTPPF